MRRIHWAMRRPRGRGERPGPCAPRTAGRRLCLALAFALPLGCGPKEESGDPLVTRGKAVYDSNCIACHAPDPTREGGLGPAVAGASLELLRARVVDGNYPPGYTPKRDTRVMVALPFLEPELPALSAYLGSLPEPQKK